MAQNIDDENGIRASAPRGTQPDTAAIPQQVRDRFTERGNRFYFPDGELAFTDRGRRLFTPSENTEVIHSLIQIAQARHWQRITVRGTDRFREEATRQAQLAGLQVRGAPRAAQRPDPEAGDSIAPQSSGQPLAVAEPQAPQRRSRRIDGTLLAHGRDTYQFDPRAEMSYFVRLQTPQGQRLIWGKDLERAFNESLTHPRVGDSVSLVPTGREPVTVYRPQPDGKRTTTLAAHRNRWVVEKQEFFDSRAAAAQLLRDPHIDPRRAAKDHPQLAGSLLAIHAAEIAARRFNDPQEQRRFVNIARAALADSVERGEPLLRVRLRDRAPRREPRDQQLQPQPERTR